MRIRTLALALALTFSAGIVVQAAQNPQAKAAAKRAKQNKKIIAKRAKAGRGKSVKMAKHKPKKSK